MMFGGPNFHKPSFVVITPRAGKTVQTHFDCLSYRAIHYPVPTARLHLFCVEHGVQGGRSIDILR